MARLGVSAEAFRPRRRAARNASHRSLANLKSTAGRAMTPEEKTRVGPDALLQQTGWHVCDMAQAHIHAAQGVALPELPPNTH